MRLLRTGLYYALLLLLALPFVLPLLWLALSALRPAAELYQLPPKWLPGSLGLENFREGWQLMDFSRFLRNSFWITGWTVIGTVFSSSLVGYAFAVLPGRGKNALFALLLGTLMVPSAVTLLPLFVLYSKLGWVGGNLPLIAPHFFANAFYVFLFRQFFRSLPRELFDSAELEGCTPLEAYRYIALPLSGPAIATAAIFSGLGAWNAFLEPLVYLTRESAFTLTVGLSFFQGLHVTQVHYLLALSLIALLPVLALFLLAQPYLIRGIAATGRS